MTQIKQPRVFFFDFDGVICDTERLHFAASLLASTPHGMGFSEEYYFSKLIGFDDRGLFQHLFAEHKKELTPTSLMNLIQEKNKISL